MENKDEIESIWNRMSHEDWIAGNGFSGKVGGLSTIPLICKPRIFKFAQAYADQQVKAERTRADQESAAYREEIERLKNDLADSLDVKTGTGPTALSMVLEENRKLKEILKELLTKIAMSFDVDYDKG